MCIYFLQTMNKELNLKFKIKETQYGCEKETIILLYCIVHAWDKFLFQIAHYFFFLISSFNFQIQAC